jgi:hypothetical protein
VKLDVCNASPRSVWSRASRSSRRPFGPEDARSRAGGGESRCTDRRSRARWWCPRGPGRGVVMARSWMTGVPSPVAAACGGCRNFSRSGHVRVSPASRVSEGVETGRPVRMRNTARAFVVVGDALHLAALLLPLVSFKCDAPQSLFSLECAIPGYLYLALPLFGPADHVLLFLLVCCWASAVLVGLLASLTDRLLLTGWFASLLVLPTYLTAIVVVPPDRLLGPICSTVGAALVLLGAIIGFASRKAPRSTGTKWTRSFSGPA